MVITEDRYTYKSILSALADFDGTVKIGTEKGGGFFYIGEAAKFKGPGAINFIDEIEQTLKSVLERQHQLSIEDYELLKRREITVNSYIKIMDAHNIEYSYDGYLKYIGEHFKNLARRKEIIKENYTMLTNRVPFSERYVREAYFSTYLENTLILIIEGEERGIYWTENEYQKQTCDDKVIEE